MPLSKEQQKIKDEELAKETLESVLSILNDDAVKFSLASLVALSAHHLYEDDADRKCISYYLTDLLKQLDVDDDTKSAVLAFMERSKKVTEGDSKDEPNPHIEPLVEVLRNKLNTSKKMLSASYFDITGLLKKTKEMKPPETKRNSDEAKPSDAVESKETEDVNKEIEEKEGDEKGEEEKDVEKSNESEEPSSVAMSTSSSFEGQGTIDEAQAIAVVSCLVVSALVRGRYDSRVRIVLRFIAHKVRIQWDLVEDVEDSLVAFFKEAKVSQTDDEKKESEKHTRIEKIKRYGAIGAAGVLGGVAIGLTGGLLAAPILGAAFATVGGLGAFIGSTAGAAVVGSLFGAMGAGLSGYKMNRRVGSVSQFEFLQLSEGHQLHLAVALPGWLSSENPDCRTAFYTLSAAKEQYCLKYESKFLIELGNALDYFLNVANSAAGKTTTFAGDLAATSAQATISAAFIWPQMLLGAANVIDNPWGVCLRRSAKVGELLAEVLMKRQQGHRPVTLVGYSLGARAIFYCLREMSRDKHKRYSGGIIQNVVMLGTPVTASPKEWSKFSHVVAGEIVNGYSNSDWLLKFLYRTTNIQTSIAGLGPVDWKNRRMFNLDLSHVVCSSPNLFR